MISKQNASISALLACLALVAILSGLWMTRPADMVVDHRLPRVSAAIWSRSDSGRRSQRE